MKLKIVAIGNSQGIRIPKPLLEQAGINSEVEVVAEGKTLILRAVEARAPRQGWSKAFALMAKQEDDHLLEAKTIKSSWDQDEWEWN